ncbi:FAD/FMN-containing dehydrogenase [Kribbella antiqua]|uniref:FAD/FMN-containing dehydrogenase n=1 Tax=Kribbella antiqua TaxID=2512217 RepID=A0A4R2IPB0_9ACTN|nr:FAD-binding oxidoreductase [Kribbella antiqua]TCO44555.1 FAD/FMN-containing dehydrogenase [Kribbella antiqua]
MTRYLRPDSPEYEAVRRPAMPQYGEVRPAVIAQCETPADVAEVLAEARKEGLPVVPRSGGHCFAGRSSTTGVVLDVSPMSSVEVSDDVAVVGAGTRLSRLYDALDAVGVTIPAGCGPTVGIAGLTLGGGIGVLGRSHGLTCDSLLAAEVVLADGRIVTCSAEQDSDLFWALRGAGGGQFGVVTRLWFSTLPTPVATRFHLTWSRADAVGVIDSWQHWAPYAWDELSASLRVTATEIHLFGLTTGEFSAPMEVSPTFAVVEQLPYRRLKESLVGLGDDPDAGESMAVSKSEFFAGPLPVAVIEELLRDAPGDVNFTPMGGAYNRVPATATAFAHRDTAFLLELVGTDRAKLAQVFSPLEPYGTGRVYTNFPDPTLDDALTAYHGENLGRLREVKRAYDPEGFFTFPQSL